MYQKSIITFLDILGFKHIVDNRNCDEINNALDLVQSFAANDGDSASDIYPTVITFSDSVIRIRNLESEENTSFPIGHLFFEVNSLLHAQIELINNDILVRGGISIGDVYVSENRIFGPGFVKAYELESRYANYPRIVLSPELVNSVSKDVLVRNENHTVNEEGVYLKSQLELGEDGLWYVDYLRALEKELDDPDMVPDFLMKHKCLIVKEGQRFNSFSSVSSKYLWLANYHNKVISEIKEKWFEHHQCDKESLMISNDELTTVTSL